MTPGRRRPSVPAARSDNLAELSLADLRSYRRRLQDEEDRVSYWRRLVHARMDVLDAGAHAERTLTVTELVRVLGDTGAGRTRQALTRVRSADPLPELPELGRMWVTEVDPHDATAVAQALELLREAEQQLTAYRRALHERIDEASGELIGRYREQPALALTVLSG